MIHSTHNEMNDTDYLLNTDCLCFCFDILSFLLLSHGITESSAFFSLTLWLISAAAETIFGLGVSRYKNLQVLFEI